MATFSFSSSSYFVVDNDNEEASAMFVCPLAVNNAQLLFLGCFTGAVPVREHQEKNFYIRVPNLVLSPSLSLSLSRSLSSCDALQFFQRWRTIVGLCLQPRLFGLVKEESGSRRTGAMDGWHVSSRCLRSYVTTIPRGYVKGRQPAL